MTKTINEELAAVAVAVRNAATPEELTKQTTALLDLLDRACEANTEADVRLHALNLACALHREGVRFSLARDDDPAAPDVAGVVLATADRFNAWLNG